MSRIAPHSNLSNRTRKAFTLIELLVVIAIIGILVAVTASIFWAKAKARQTICLAHVKGIGTALELYVARNDGYYLYCGADEEPTKPCPENLLVSEEFCAQDLFFCPEDQPHTYWEIKEKYGDFEADMFWPGDNRSGEKYFRYMYWYSLRDGEVFTTDGMQSSYIWEQGVIDRPLRKEQVPAETILMTEGSHVVNCWTWSSLTASNDPRSDQVHLGKNVNVLRANGSAETCRLKEIAR